MKLNLGCGNDLRKGYVNVDLYPPFDENVDLGNFPWPWADESADEIMMLDFLEHFSYRLTGKILSECWRVLRAEGTLIVQVPDFEHCAKAILHIPEITYQCNDCGEYMDGDDYRCPKCKKMPEPIQDAGIHRLYGGQDRPGNWHHTAFTKRILERHLRSVGFDQITDLERAHQTANWNFKFAATKSKNLWGEQ